MSEKLKPCPFCGGEAIMGKACHVHEDYAFRVECRECKIVTPFYDTEAEAIEAWNRRVATDKNVGDKERTAKVVHKQETHIVTPPKSTTIEYETVTNLWNECGNCGAMGMYHGWNYCPKCGVKLDWSEL